MRIDIDLVYYRDCKGHVDFYDYDFHPCHNGLQEDGKICPECEGKGYILTPEGVAVISLLERVGLRSLLEKEMRRI